jgi:hypothetical protein
MGVLSVWQDGLDSVNAVKGLGPGSKLVVNVKLLRLLGLEVDAGAKALNCENVEKTVGLPHNAILAVCFSGQPRSSNAGESCRSPERRECHLRSPFNI